MRQHVDVTEPADLDVSLRQVRAKSISRVNTGPVTALLVLYGLNITSRYVCNYSGCVRGSERFPTAS